jgi:hypothetical protein
MPVQPSVQRFAPYRAAALRLPSPEQRLAPRRREEARPAARQWGRPAESRVFLRQEAHPQAASYRQLVAACRGRRAADPYVVMERLPEGHPEAVSCRQPAGACREHRGVPTEAASQCPQPGAWSLPRPPAAAVWWERPAVPAWVSQAQRPG